LTLAQKGGIGKMLENSDFPDGNSTVGLLAELADAMDSKSISQKEYRFKSDRGHFGMLFLRVSLTSSEAK
jgi:hypothetical protein